MKKLIISLVFILFTNAVPVFAATSTAVTMTPVIIMMGAASSTKNRQLRRENQETMLLDCLKHGGGRACYEKNCKYYPEDGCYVRGCLKNNGGNACYIKGNPNYTMYRSCVKNNGGKACQNVLNPNYRDFKECLRYKGGKACYSKL